MTENNKRIRTAARKSVTKAMNTAKDYTSEDIGEHENDLRGLSTLIKTKLNILDDLDAKIFVSCEEEDLDREMRPILTRPNGIKPGRSSVKGCLPHEL